MWEGQVPWKTKILRMGFKKKCAVNYMLLESKNTKWHQEVENLINKQAYIRQIQTKRGRDGDTNGKRQNVD